MFTGIIQAIGRIAALQSSGADMRLRVHTGKLHMKGVVLGDSIAVSGVCLTVVDLPGDGFWADVSRETLQRTVLGDLGKGAAVNLELALAANARLGGHLVSGHVDGVGVVHERRDAGRSVYFRIQAPDELARYIAQKGSICADGVSLTVNSVDAALFDLNIVPHTLKATTLDAWIPGQRVNLEVDLIARYLERLLLGDAAALPARPAGKEDISAQFLVEHGYIKK